MPLTFWTRLRRGMITWAPVALVMIVIFIASAQPGIDPADHPTDSVRVSGLMPFVPKPWDVLLKKGGHIAVYTALSLVLLRAFRRERVSLARASWLTVLTAGAYAASDELHQAFVPQRGSSVIDVGIDLFGVAMGLILARWWLNHRPAPESTRASGRSAHHRPLRAGNPARLPPQPPRSR